MISIHTGIVCGLLLAFQASSCDQRRPPPPPQTPPPPAPRPPLPPPPPQPNPIMITGNERLTWDQPVQQGSDIRAHEFSIYVDGERQPASDASCEPVAGPPVIGAALRCRRCCRDGTICRCSPRTS